MDAMLSEPGRTVVRSRTTSSPEWFVTGNENGAHHIIVVVSQMLIDIGHTIPAKLGRTG